MASPHSILLPFFQTVCVFCFISMSITAQFTDNFSDGDFSDWSGNIEKFELENEFLHLNDTSESSPASLVNPIATQGATEWQFFVSMTFAPSNNNNGRIYLRSNSSNLEGNLNGYYVRIGESGSPAEDGIDLYVQNGSNSDKIIDGIPGTAIENPAFWVRVVVDESNNWELFYNTEGPSNWISQGTIMDDSYDSGNFIGVQTRYTGSNAAAFYFDDFYVDPVFIDTAAPEISNISIIDGNSVQVTFSESIDAEDAENTNNYSVNGLGAPSMAMLEEGSSNTVILFFDMPFPQNENLTLTVENIEDLGGNVLNGSGDFSFAVLGSKDVVINEIFADPSPVVGLPDAEFIELFNRTDFEIDLNGWTFSDPTNTATIENTSIPANGYLIVCKSTEVELWEPFGPAVGVANFPSLNNASDVISLADAFGNTIDVVSYSSNWYGDLDKSEGGYTLELRDADYPCQGAATWIASENASGGTPGQINSVIGLELDNSPPDLLNAIATNSQLVTLYFSESINASTDLNDYSINPSLGINNLSIETDKIIINLSDPIANGTIYTIEVSNLSDCSNNPIGMFNSAQFALGEAGTTGDVVINEILFNPATGGADYVELYNRSDKIIDLSEWFIGHQNSETAIGFISDSVRISQQAYTLFPDDYVVLTKDPQWVIETYGGCETLNPTKFIEVELPSYNDGDGMVGIIRNNDQNEVLDQMSYLDDWHFELLDDVDGVSLERIDPDGNSNVFSNWHSASASSCNGTPSYKNSQFYGSNPLGEATIGVEPATFSPDGDANNDFALIQYQFPEPGYSVNITIFDDNGRKIRRLARTEILGQSGQYKWDGADDNGDKAPIGIYIIYIEAFNLNGDIQNFKEVCVLAGEVE